MLRLLFWDGHNGVVGRCIDSGSSGSGLSVNKSIDLASIGSVSNYCLFALNHGSGILAFDFINAGITGGIRKVNF